MWIRFIYPIGSVWWVFHSISIAIIWLHPIDLFGWNRFTSFWLNKKIAMDRINWIRFVAFNQIGCDSIRSDLTLIQVDWFEQISIECVSIKLNFNALSMEFDLFHCLNWFDLLDLDEIDCFMVGNMWFGFDPTGERLFGFVCVGSDWTRSNSIDTGFNEVNYLKLKWIAWMFDPIQSNHRVNSICFDWLRPIGPLIVISSIFWFVDPIGWLTEKIDWGECLVGFDWLRLARIRSSFIGMKIFIGFYRLKRNLIDSLDGSTWLRFDWSDPLD